MPEVRQPNLVQVVAVSAISAESEWAGTGLARPESTKKTLPRSHEGHEENLFGTSNVFFVVFVFSWQRMRRVGKHTSRSSFTRAPDYPQFVPEAGRTPGYPVFLAAVERALGPGHLAIAIAQAGLFVMICLAICRVGKLVATPTEAAAAGLITALYPPLPYFGALAMSEVLTVAAVTLGILFWVQTLVVVAGQARS
jgi:hypothetical protein